MTKRHHTWAKPIAGLSLATLLGGAILAFQGKWDTALLGLGLGFVGLIGSFVMHTRAQAAQSLAIGHDILDQAKATTGLLEGEVLLTPDRRYSVGFTPLGPDPNPSEFIRLALGYYAKTLFNMGARYSEQRKTLVLMVGRLLSSPLEEALSGRPRDIAATWLPEFNHANELSVRDADRYAGVVCWTDTPHPRSGRVVLTDLPARAEKSEAGVDPNGWAATTFALILWSVFMAVQADRQPESAQMFGELAWRSLRNLQATIPTDPAQIDLDWVRDSQNRSFAKAFEEYSNTLSP